MKWGYRLLLIAAMLLSGCDVTNNEASQFTHPEKYYEGKTFISEEIAHELVKRHVKVIGLDAGSPDQDPFPIHKILLAAEILIIENLTNLESLIGKKFEVIALPAKFDADSAPVRVVARVQH